MGSLFPERISTPRYQCEEEIVRILPDLEHCILVGVGHRDHEEIVGEIEYAYECDDPLRISFSPCLEECESEGIDMDHREEESPVVYTRYSGTSLTPYGSESIVHARTQRHGYHRDDREGYDIRELMHSADYDEYCEELSW